jgi:succinoglycan biosynthesis transport protein ExoP
MYDADLPQPNDGQSLFPEIHLWDYVQIVLQRLPLALITFGAVLGLAILYTWTRPVEYTAQARLLVEPSRINLTNIDNTLDPTSSALARREFLQTQAKLLTSRDVLEQVCSKLNLPEHPLFQNTQDITKTLEQLIVVTPARNTYLIDISVELESPQLAADIVNATLDAHLAVSRKRRLGISEEGLAQLEEKAVQFRERLEQATLELQQFMAQNNMVSFEKSQSVVMARLHELNGKLNDLQPLRMSVQSEVEAANEALAAGQLANALPSVIESPVVKELKLELAKLQNEHSQLLLRLGENHPKLQAISSEIDSLQTRMAVEATAILEAKRTELAQLLKEEKLISAAIRDQEADVRDFNRLADHYTTLKQAKDAIEGPYNRIMTRVSEIDVSRIGAQGENLFIDYSAVVPHANSPTSPNKMKNMLVAAILGGALALALCFFLDYMDTTIKSDVDVRRAMDSRVLTTLPRISSERELQGGTVDQVVKTNPRSHAAEAFRALRTSLAFSLPGERVQVVAVSSTLPSEGKSMTACNLAATHALSGKRTLLIDADMRKPRLHHAFSINTESSLSELLKGGDPMPDLLHLPTANETENLYLLPCGAIPRNPAELLESSRFEELLLRAREQFDFVVVDTPPGFTLVDPIIAGRLADGIVLVVRSFVTPKAIAKQFAQRMREAGVPLLGICLNGIDTPRSAQGYATYGYGKYYRKYYESEES